MQRKAKLDEISKEVHQGVQAGCGTTIARGRSGGLGGAQSGTDPIVPLLTSRRPLAQSVLGGSGTSRCSPSFLARPDASATGLSLFFPRPDLRPPFLLGFLHPSSGGSGKLLAFACGRVRRGGGLSGATGQHGAKFGNLRVDMPLLLLESKDRCGDDFRGELLLWHVSLSHHPR